MKNRIIQLRKKASRTKRNSPYKAADSSNLRLIQIEGNTFIYYYSRTVAIFQSNDLFARNITIINIYLNQKIKQLELARVFGLSERRIKQLVTLYRYQGMAGLAGPDPTRFSCESEVHLDHQNSIEPSGCDGVLPKGANRHLKLRDVQHTANSVSHIPITGVMN